MQHQPTIPPGACQIEIKPGIVAIVDADDYRWLKLFKWKLTGSGQNWYAWAYIPSMGKDYPMHRLVLNHDGIVDHINGNGLDNRKANLRPATAKQNARNSRQGTGALPIVYSKAEKGYVARIKLNGKVETIGVYDSAIDAAVAFNEVARSLYGEFAWQHPTKDYVGPSRQKGRPPRPWYYANRDAWYVNIKGKRYRLANGKDSAEAAQRAFALMVKGES